MAGGSSPKVSQYIGRGVVVRINALTLRGIIKKIFLDKGSFLIRLSEDDRGGYMTVHPDKVDDLSFG